MILMDLSQIFFSNLHVAISKPEFKEMEDEVVENTIRHMILNSIRSYRSKMVEEWGEIVICVDSEHSWRAREFLHYKERRRIKRKESSLDWSKIFSMFTNIKNELESVFPYRFISVNGAEADDIIGTVVHDFNSKVDKILILSGDKDFKQLLIYPNVKLYSPVKKEFLEEEDIEYYNFEHIIIGDSSDDIPNIFSDDDVFVTEGKRQKPIRKKKILEWWEDKETPLEEKLGDAFGKFQRNKYLIDLSYVPQDIKHDIYYHCRKDHNKSRDKILDYLVEHELNKLQEKIEDF